MHQQYLVLSNRQGSEQRDNFPPGNSNFEYLVGFYWDISNNLDGKTRVGQIFEFVKLFRAILELCSDHFRGWLCQSGLSNGSICLGTNYSVSNETK